MPTTRRAADGDWATTIEWRRSKRSSVARATWRVPGDASGAFRFTYLDVAGATSTKQFTISR